jgi:hypothetical protein
LIKKTAWILLYFVCGAVMSWALFSGIDEIQAEREQAAAVEKARITARSEIMACHIAYPCSINSLGLKLVLVTSAKNKTKR